MFGIISNFIYQIKDLQFICLRNEIKILEFYKLFHSQFQPATQPSGQVGYFQPLLAMLTLGNMDALG